MFLPPMYRKPSVSFAKQSFAIGSVLCGLAVTLGAFGAHALKVRLAPDSLAAFEVGVRYQMYHGLALLALALVPLADRLAEVQKPKRKKLASSYSPLSQGSLMTFIRSKP